MASELPPNDNWDRVASELRAYRDAQQQAWGQIDNATLGRFIAGDLSSDEQRHIEQALQERPELRKLTDLVRDVLADFEPAAEPAKAPPIPAPAPRILPFPKPQPTRSSVVRWVTKRSGILAAACLLLALSAALLDPRVSNTLLGNNDLSNTDTGLDLAMNRSGVQPVYLRADKPIEPTSSARDTVAGTRLAFAPSAAGLDRLEMLNQKIDGLEQEGKLEDALALDDKAATVARRAKLEQHLEYAANRERVAVISQKQGDLDRACSSLCQAYEIRKKELGPDNKETAKTAQSLAGVCAVALHADAEKPMAMMKFAPEHAQLTTGHHSERDLRSDHERKTTADLHERLVHNPALVDAMVESLSSNSPEVRTTAANVLVRLGPAVREYLGHYLKRDGKGVRDDGTNRLVRDVVNRIDKAQRDRLGIVVGTTASQVPSAALFGD
jgi:hypothetical protein